MWESCFMFFKKQKRIRKAAESQNDHMIVAAINSWRLVAALDVFSIHWSLFGGWRHRPRHTSGWFPGETKAEHTRFRPIFSSVTQQRLNIITAAVVNKTRRVDKQYISTERPKVSSPSKPHWNIRSCGGCQLLPQQTCHQKLLHQERAGAQASARKPSGCGQSTEE